MSRELVSVIIPFKERFEKVVRALRSVEAQTYNKVEVILVDDASEGNFYVDLNTFNLTIKYIRLAANQGPGGARNEGLKHAKGEFIAFLDSDDYWKPEFLDKAFTAHSEGKDLTFVYSFTRVLNNGKDEGLRMGGKICKSILPDIFIYGRPWSTSSCLWRKSTIDESGAFLNTRCWEDYDFDVRVAIIHNKIYCIPEPLTNYEIYGIENLSSQPKVTALTEKSKSMLSISQAIRNSDYRYDSQLICNYLNTYLGVTAQLIDNGHFEQAQSNLNEIGEWSELSSNSLFLARILTSFRLKISSRYIRRLKLEGLATK